MKKIVYEQGLNESKMIKRLSKIGTLEFKTGLKQDKDIIKILKAIYKLESERGYRHYAYESKPFDWLIRVDWVNPTKEDEK